MFWPARHFSCGAGARQTCLLPRSEICLFLVLVVIIHNGNMSYLPSEPPICRETALPDNTDLLASFSVASISARVGADQNRNVPSIPAAPSLRPSGEKVVPLICLSSLKVASSR